MLVAAIAPHSNVASRTLPAFRGGEAEITRNRTDFIKTLQVHPSLADLAAGNRMAAELTLRGSLQNGAAPGALPAGSVHPPLSFPVNFFKPIGAASRTAAVTSDLTFKPIGAAPDAELLSFGETSGTTKIGDDSVPTVGVTGGGAAAPLKALWRAGPPDAQPLTELCIFENLIEGEEATVARFVTTEAGFTTATAHSKIEADEPDTKVCDSLPPSGLLAGPLLSPSRLFLPASRRGGVPDGTSHRVLFSSGREGDGRHGQGQTERFLVPPRGCPRPRAPLAAFAWLLELGQQARPNQG